MQIHLNKMSRVLFLTPLRFGTKGEFGELAKLLEEGIANSGVQSLNTTEAQKEECQGTLNIVVGSVVLSDG